MQTNPFLLLLMTALCFYIGRLWLADLRAARAGQKVQCALPGATEATECVVGLAVLGALLILAAETFGEELLGLTEQQTTITALFGLYTLGAAIVEEVIFRGYLVIEKHGAAALWGSVLVMSVLFAALHPFLWHWEDGRLIWSLTAKGWFSTGVIFATSLWLYAMRFCPLNPHRSLAPCIAAHLAGNLGVFAIKCAQGFVHGWF